ncbi:MAG: hypothetical protein GY820_11585 [Gammaproteobacteria bacterium]|nr:hypothetical protein [Gammaproteobacteria bacterium]
MYWFMKYWYGDKNQFDDKLYNDLSAELTIFNDYIKNQSPSDIQQLLASTCQNLQIFLKAFQDNEEWKAKWITELGPAAYRFFRDLNKIEEYYWKSLDNSDVEKDYTFPVWHNEFKAVTENISTFVSAEVGNNKILQKPNAYIASMLLA